MHHARDRHVRWYLPLVLLGLVAGCASEPEVTPCPDPRPQVCTMQYEPTCAELTAGGRAEYSSPCNACADDAVSGTLEGACPE